MSYSEVYEAWKSDPESFWMSAAEGIDWDVKPTRALFDENAPIYNWFSDGQVNTCWNAVDRHVEGGRGEQAAIIYDSPVTSTTRMITYAQLQDQVAQLAGALAARGVTKGDRVIVYMPMVPEAVVAMLAVTRIGAVHSVVFGGFAANELAVRIDDARPKAIIAGSCGIEPGRVVEYKPLLDGAIDLAAHKPDFCIILQREQAEASLVEGRDVEWNAAQQGVEPAPCVPVAGNDPAYILYTSGTTPPARPKA
jgi:propionyl-CoA synthetase